ncbi:WD40-repeat-containing domain protein [Polychytrium aggregatum]|uniref:WD40-repeat-containing domain protein n=1 Tax=Polychytrium aggregatum TaxID=110093 RepID=UPI0022FF1B49|nr:WD40-repeat-containing domain protein [Polychytrium aggregatum]KAI9203420.1 WD40-repeat-containing domain protein [Polychytrium aggregatum]
MSRLSNYRGIPGGERKRCNEPSRSIDMPRDPETTPQQQLEAVLQASQEYLKEEWADDKQTRGRLREKRHRKSKPSSRSKSKSKSKSKNKSGSRSARSRERSPAHGAAQSRPRSKTPTLAPDDVRKTKTKTHESNQSKGLFRHLDKSEKDFESQVVLIKIHSIDALELSSFIVHPVVKISFIDATTGQYLSKGNKEKPATYFNEGKAIDYILPLMTKPYKLQGRKVTPLWEEEIVVDVEYLSILKPSTMMLFEVLDFTTNSALAQKTHDGWHRIAWAFLKLVGHAGNANTEQMARLQMYRYPKIKNEPPEQDNIPNAYYYWQMEKEKYPSTLYVTVKAHVPPRRRQVIRRANLPTDIEIGKMTLEQMLDEYSEKKKIMDPMMKSLLALSNAPKWRREPGQSGSFACSFSNGGIYVAIACVSTSSYPIKVYDVLTGDRVATLEGHQDLVYSLSWASEDDELISASSDGTVRVWFFGGDGSVRQKSVILHPAYVYTAVFHPMALNPRHVSCLNGHSSRVNSIVFGEEGRKMYSGDGSGVVKVWSCEIPGLRRGEVAYDCIKTLSPLQDASVTCLKLHPNFRKLLIRYSNGTIHLVDSRIYRLLTVLQDKQLDASYSPPKSGPRSTGDHSGYANHFWRASFSPCGTFVAAGGEDGQATVWRCDTGAIVTVYRRLGLQFPIDDLQFHPHDHLMLFISFGYHQPAVVWTFDAADPPLAAPKAMEYQLSSAAMGNDDILGAMERRREELNQISTALTESIQNLDSASLGQSAEYLAPRKSLSRYSGKARAVDID